MSRSNDAAETEAAAVASAVMEAPPVHRPMVSAGRANPFGRRSGNVLPVAERAFFEPRFGASLANVRLHHDAAADRATRALHARAFTIGDHIAFRSGEYRPGSRSGRQLIAHELTHTLQQEASGLMVQRNGSLHTDASQQAVDPRCRSTLDWSDGGHWIGSGTEPDCSPATTRSSRTPTRLTGFFSHQATTRRRALSRVLQNIYFASANEGNAAASNVQRNAAEIRAAAASTGPNGIPPRLLGGIVCVEMMNRGYWMSAEFRLTWALSDPSLGLTQMRLSTAAMARGDIPWQEARSPIPAHREAALSALERNFEALPDEDYLIEILRSPRRSLRLTARYLARLKNRSNRYPNQTAAQFAQNGRGLAIIATEYHLGPTATPETSASPDFYGDQVRAISGTSDFADVMLGY